MLNIYDAEFAIQIQFCLGRSAQKIWGNLYKHEKKYNDILPKNVIEQLIMIWRKDFLYPLFSFAQETEISPPLSTVMLDNEKS